MRLILFAAVLALLVVVAPAGPARPADVVAPRFVVDPAWPKPLPNHWRLGQVSGVAVDARDHVWIVQRPKTMTATDHGVVAAPPVIEFDAEGNVVQAWGGPGSGYDWPSSEHGIFVDHRDNVWLAGNGANDRQVLKFTRAGRFVMQIGKPGAVHDDGDVGNLGRPADVRVDPTTDDLYVADGYGNRRVIVFDAATGRYKRHWGADGRPPGERGVRPFGLVHCVRIARDGLVYVCDRRNNRIQVFRRDGGFVKEIPVAPDTRGAGATWDVEFSVDSAQTYLYTADGENNHVWILLRDPGRILGRFGRHGRDAGQLHWVHNLAVDSKGNLYTTEVDTGKRVQRFIYRGLAPVEP